MFGLLLFTCGALFAPVLPWKLCLTGLTVLWSGLGIVVSLRHFRSRAFELLPLLLALTSGFAVGYGQILWQVHQQLPEHLSGTDAELVFAIVSKPKLGERQASFNARVIDTFCEQAVCGLKKGHLLRVSWYYPDKELLAGQQWRATLRIKRPRGLANPAGFDYQAWLLSEGFYATGYVRGEAALRAVEDNISTYRQALGERLFGKLELTYRRFFAALLLGDKTELQRDDWQVLRATGTIHLMAISGLHIGLVATQAFLITLFFVRFWALFSSASNAAVFQRLPPLCALLAAGAYAALAGFTIPTTRAFLACALVCFWALGGRRLYMGNLVVLCCAVTVVVQPFAVFNSGFWLSFGAVLILLWTLRGRMVSPWFSLPYVQLVLFVGLMLPLIILGQNISVSAPAANLMAVPLITLLVVPGLFLALAFIWWPGVSAVILKMVDAGFAALWWALSQFAEKVPQWHAGFFQHPALLALAALGALLLLTPRALGLQVFGLSMLVVCLFAPGQRDFIFRLSVLDAGQGLAMVLETPSELPWVYDTGASFSADFNIGSAVVAPYLRQQGYGRARVIVSHGDSDHAGGLNGLSEQVEVATLYSGETQYLPGVARQACEAGQSWRVGTAHFTFLWPPAGHRLEGNDASCVLWVSLASPQGQKNLLFTGDISREVERQLLNRLPGAVDLLVAPHHGSKTSSHPSFVQVLKPRAVIFSAGHKNRYRHPNPQVLARYQKAGSDIFNTAADGAVIFTWDKDGRLNIDPIRKSSARLWY